MLETTAAVAAAAGYADRAALGAAERMREPLGTVPPSYEQVVRERGVAAVRAALEADAAGAAWDRGRQLDYATAMAAARGLAERPTG